MSADNGNAASFSRILHWVTGAYPNGTPAEDRIPLIALLSRKLSAEQIYTAMSILTPEVIDPGNDRFITREEIGQTVDSITKAAPSASGLRRVAGKLAAAGWPLDGLA